VFYFVSLVLSLSVSAVCILAKQWIREYQRDPPVSARDAARIRQMRFDSFEAWKVSQIIASLPVILLAALVLFFTGLLIQLWHVSEHTTAAAVSVVAGLTGLFILATTIIPAYYIGQKRRASFTPFRSPQAWLLVVMTWPFRRAKVFFRVDTMPSNWVEFDIRTLHWEVKDSWLEKEVTSIHRALEWLFRVFQYSPPVEEAILWCLQSSSEDLSPGLITSEQQMLLSRYVLYGALRPGSFRTGKGSVTRDMSRASGRYQIEILIRSANDAIDHLQFYPKGWDADKHWTTVLDCCRHLWYYHRTSYLGLSDTDQFKDCESLHDVFLRFDVEALSSDRYTVIYHANCMFSRIFAVEGPLNASVSSSNIYVWFYILDALWDTSYEIRRADFPPDPAVHLSEDYLANQTRHILAVGVPETVRKLQSMELVWVLGHTLCQNYQDDDYWDHAIQYFTQLDLIVVEMRNSAEFEPGTVKDLNNENLEKWRQLRLLFARLTREREVVDLFRFQALMLGPAPSHLQLDDDYFDHLVNHGPLRDLSDPPGRRGNC